MTEPEPRIVALIDAYAPAAAGMPDWHDVVRRASAPAARPAHHGAADPPHRGRPRRLLAGSAVAGVGPGRLLLGLVRDDEPAPAPVKHALAHVFHWPHGTHVLLDQSRLVSPPDRGHAIGRTTGGQSCRSSKTGSRRSPTAATAPGSASFPATTAAGIQLLVHRTGRSAPPYGLIQTSPSGWRRNAGIVHWDPWLLDGTAPARTARMVLVHRDGRRTLVPLLPRLVAGLRYFAVRLAPETAATADGPARFVALDANGRRIAAAALTRRNVHPLINTPGGAAAPPGRSVGFGSIRTTFHGQRGTARLSVAINSTTGRARCLDVDFAADAEPNAGSSFSLCTAASSGLEPAIDINLGTHVAFGSVPRAATTVRMILRDGTVVPVPAHDGAYVAVIGNARFRSGNLPARLVGRDAGGHVVARYVFSRSRDFPDY